LDQIPELVVFEERLDNSLQRDLVKIEHVRLRIAHEQINSELVDMELVELKFVFDRCVSFFVTCFVLQTNLVSVHHDNRDLEILTNYQPCGQPSFLSQTTLFGKELGVGTPRFKIR
jgi:N-terminal acetyltransferase B complex non-catalytic subunit